MPWRGADWVNRRLVAAGFQVPRIATQAYVAEAVKLGLLESAEFHDRFWTEFADEILRNAVDGTPDYRSPYIEALVAGQDRQSFARLNPALFHSLGAFPMEARESFRGQFQKVIRDRKAVEIASGDYESLARLVDRGPAAVFKALAKTLPLSFARGKELGVPLDGPCLVGATSGPLRPVLFFEPGRRMARVNLSASVFLLRDADLVRGIVVRDTVPGLHWYSTIVSAEEEALGLAAYARFVVELAAALNDGEETGKAP